MQIKSFGTLPSGETVNLYILESDGARLAVTDFGAAIVSFTVGGVDIVGGFDTLDGYLTDDSHQGGIIGRVANRIGGAEFEMHGRVYSLPKNDGNNCLHGGCGFDRRLWHIESLCDESVTLTYISEDGEEGFPSRLAVRVGYTLVGGTLRIDYEARPDGKTPISLTNHAYFNLEGFGSDISRHRLTVYADSYTEVGADLIPTGARPSVEGTPYDLRGGVLLGELLLRGVELDHNYILTGERSIHAGDKMLRHAATLTGGSMKMEVYTDQPGVQVYSGNFLGNGTDFKGGVKQLKHGAICLETQVEPGCIKRGESIYYIGEVYTHTTVYSVEELSAN